MAFIDHTQSVGSTAWVVSHNFNTDSVVVDVSINSGGNLEKILPLSVISTDNNTTTVNFSSAQTGVVRIIANIDA